MTNEQMKAGRFAKLAKGRKIIARVTACWDRGGFVRVGTCTRYSDYKPKHRDMVRMGATGALFTQSGKKWLCIDFCSIQFSD
jgi:hypothetical protein